MKRIREADLAYLAGLFDGEGYIGYVKRRDRQKRKANHINLTLQVRLTNTNYPLLLWLQEVSGIGHITELRGIRYGYKPCYQWCCYGDNARELIKLLKPHLKVKAGQGFLI